MRSDNRSCRRRNQRVAKAGIGKARPPPRQHLTRATRTGCRLRTHRRKRHPRRQTPRCRTRSRTMAEKLARQHEHYGVALRMETCAVVEADRPCLRPVLTRRTRHRLETRRVAYHSISPQRRTRTYDMTALLFDLDGTLIDTIELLVDCMHHAFEGRARKPTREEWIAGIGTPLRTQLAAWADDDAMVEA